MFFGRQTKRSLSVLEQACERYATMAYEVFTGELAYGLKSVKYSYAREAENRISFVAVFTPFDEPIGLPPQSVVIVHLIVNAVSGQNSWRLNSAIVGEVEDETSKVGLLKVAWTIRFNRQNKTLVIRHPDNIAYAGNGPNRSEWNGPSDPTTKDHIFV